MRAMVRESAVNLDGLVQPLFIDETIVTRVPVASMPGVDRLPVSDVAAEGRAIYASGVNGVLLFGIPASKDARASAAADDAGVVQRAIAILKTEVPDLLIIADLCNCEYTDHGHCGILDAHGEVDNDQTLELLVATALSYARAGVDVIAPSDMMDGRVRAIRTALDAAGYTRIAIMSYAVKYASAFYGPFRDAADSAPAFGDRQGYQMDPHNSREALREARLDAAEGADMLIVKPAMAYLDIVQRLREVSELPLAVYNVSGEYAMIKAAAASGWIDETRIVDELFAGFARAGASIIISYFARSYAARHGASHA